MDKALTINKEFTEIIKTKGGNKSAIGKMLGDVSGQLLGQYAKGKMKPKEQFFQKWEKAFNEDIRWAFETNVSKNANQGTEQQTTISTLLNHQDRLISVIERLTNSIAPKKDQSRLIADCLEAIAEEAVAAEYRAGQAAEADKEHSNQIPA